MPGMNNGLDQNDPTVVAAFRAALLHQGIIALLIFAVLSVAWVSVRGQPDGARAQSPNGPVLRIGFGVLWLADAVLLAQPGMAAGLPSQVIGPSAVTSPAWVQHLAVWAGDAWSYHPVEVASATLWIEAGIGLWLLAAPRGTSSRLAGLASLTWGLVVWVFGESFGQIFAPGRGAGSGRVPRPGSPARWSAWSRRWPGYRSRRPYRRCCPASAQSSARMASRST